MILTDKRILITRDARQAEPFAAAIASYGGTEICFPTIAISEPESWGEVDKRINRLSEYDWLIFTSANSVEYLMHRLHILKIKLPALDIAAIGSKTQKSLQECGYAADVLPDIFTAAELLKTLKTENLVGKRVLLPVSDIARQELSDGLRELGANVDRVVVYQNDIADPENKKYVLDLIQQNKIDVLTFFSPSAVYNFCTIVGRYALETIRQHDIVIAVIGPTTADAVLQSGLTPHIEPKNSTSRDMLNAMINYYQNKKD